MNRVKDILKEGGAVIGTAAFPSDDVAFLAGSDFDFLLFDTACSGRDKGTRTLYKVDAR